MKDEYLTYNCPKCNLKFIVKVVIPVMKEVYVEILKEIQYRINRHIHKEHNIKLS